MRKIKNTIKINGHTYDAITGELLSAGKPIDHQVVAVEQPVVAGSVITPSATASKTALPVQKPTHNTSKKSVHRPPAKATERETQHSKTLMRHSVRKPSHAANSHDKTHIRSTSMLIKTPTAIELKKSARHIDEKRLRKATHIVKSQQVTKFSKPIPSAHHTVQHTPRAKAQAIQHHATTTHQRPAKHQTVHRQKTSADILQEALHHATSHRQPAPKRHLSRSQRVAGFSALVVVSGALLGIVATQSAPNIKMRVASAKAGFAASMPGYSPAGFHMSDLQYGAGAVAMNYDSNSDSSRKFSITQKTSAWDSITLRDTVVAKADRDFRVVEDGGLTIYLYGQNNATWVSQGVWYQVQGNGSLSDRQLVDIAKSL